MAVTSCDFCFHYTAGRGKVQPLGAEWTAPSLCLHSQKSAPESGFAQVPALFYGKYRLCGLPRPEEGPGRLEDHGQGLYRGLRLRPSIGKQTFPPCVGAERSFVLCRPAYTGGREYPQAGSADSGKMGRLDHHLTTPSSQTVRLSFFTLQHPFITIKNSAGSCAHYTIFGAGSLYFPGCHSSPTRLLRPTGL